MEARQSIECIVCICIIFVEFLFNIHTWNRLGYSKKGYTNGEIGVAWIANFDKQTKAKAGDTAWRIQYLGLEYWIL